MNDLPMKIFLQWLKYLGRTPKELTIKISILEFIVPLLFKICALRFNFLSNF